VQVAINCYFDERNASQGLSSPLRLFETATALNRRSDGLYGIAGQHLRRPTDAGTFTPRPRFWPKEAVAYFPFPTAAFHSDEHLNCRVQFDRVRQIRSVAGRSKPFCKDHLHTCLSV
jgi:hypothetical protein